MPVPSGLEMFEQTRQTWLNRKEGLRLALEEGTPLGGDRRRVVEILLKNERRVARVESVDVRAGHLCAFVAGRSRLPERSARHDGDRHADEEARRADHHRCAR